LRLLQAGRLQPEEEAVEPSHTEEPEAERRARVEQERGVAEECERGHALGPVESQPEGPQPAHRVGDEGRAFFGAMLDRTITPHELRATLWTLIEGEALGLRGPALEPALG